MIIRAILSIGSVVLRLILFLIVLALIWPVVYWIGFASHAIGNKYWGPSGGWGLILLLTLIASAFVGPLFVRLASIFFEFDCVDFGSQSSLCKSKKHWWSSQQSYCPYCGGKIRTRRTRSMASGEESEVDYCPQCLKRKAEEAQERAKASSREWDQKAPYRCKQCGKGAYDGSYCTYCGGALYKT